MSIETFIDPLCVCLDEDEMLKGFNLKLLIYMLISLIFLRLYFAPEANL